MRAFGIADTVQIMHRHAALLNGILNDLQRPFTVMQCCITRLETFSRRSDVRVPDIGKYSRRAIDVVLDDPRTKLVRRALQPEREIWPVYASIINEQAVV